MKKEATKPKVAEKAEAPGPAAAPVKEPTAPPKQFRCVGVDASTGKAVLEEVEDE